MQVFGLWDKTEHLQKCHPNMDHPERPTTCFMKMLLVVLPTRLGANQIYYLGLFVPSGETIETLQSRMFVLYEKFIFV